MKGCGWMKFAPALLAVSLGAATYQVEKKVDDGTEGTLSWALSKAHAEQDTVVFAGEFSRVAGQSLPAIVVRPDGSSLQQVFVSARTAVVEGGEGPAGRLKSLQEEVTGLTGGGRITGVEQIPAPLAGLPSHRPVVQGVRPWESGMDDYVSLPDYPPQPADYELPIINAERVDEPALAQFRRDVALKALVEGAMVVAAPEWAQSVAAPESFDGVSESGSELPLLQMLGSNVLTPDVTEVANFYRAGFALSGGGLASLKQEERVLSVSSSVYYPLESADLAAQTAEPSPEQITLPLVATPETVALATTADNTDYPHIGEQSGFGFKMPRVQPGIRPADEPQMVQKANVAPLGLELQGEVVALRPRVVLMAPVSAPLPPAPEVKQEPVVVSGTPAGRPLMSNLSESEVELSPVQPFHYAQTVELAIEIERQTASVASVSPTVNLGGALAETGPINVKNPCPDTDVAVSLPSPRPVLAPVFPESNGRVLLPVMIH